LIVSQDPEGQPVEVDAAVDYDFTPDGRRLIVTTTAGNLIAGDYNRASDVLFFDLKAEVFYPVSAPASGYQNQAADGPPSISPNWVSGDGRFVVYSGYGSNGVTNDFNLSSDVFLFDRQFAATTLISVNTNGTSSQGASSRLAQITPDGRFVLFLSTARDLVSDVVGAGEQAFVRDTWKNTTTLVSIAEPALTNPGRYYTLTITDDGRYVLYYPGASRSAVVRDMLHGVSTIIPSSGGAVANSANISANGATVAWLQSSGIQTTYVLAVFSLKTGQTQTYDGLFATRPVVPIMISADGSLVAAYRGISFGSFLTLNLVTGATNILNTPPEAVQFRDGILSTTGSTLVFEAFANQIHQLYAIQTAAALLTTNALGAAANGASHNASLSRDGRFLVFTSEASDLVDGDTNGVSDVFLRDMETGAISLIDRGLGGALGQEGAANAVVSDDGAVVMFTSGSSNFSPNMFSLLPQVYAAQVMPHLDLPVVTDSDVSIGWQSAASVTYQLQTRNSLGTGAWQNLGPTKLGDGTPLSEQFPLSDSSRFFRLVIVP
jgi:hypothetical protein